ncbi:serine hydrolase domain-containing protein [Fusibacter bizertensis]
MKLNHLNVVQKMEKHQIKGVSVSLIEEGRLKSVNHYGVRHAVLNQEVDDNAVFNACSISKFATAVLALKLVSKGVLHLDENVNEQLKSWQVPENAFTKTQKVTLRNLLCHQAGFIDPDGSFGVYNSAEKKPSILDLLVGNSSYYLERAEVKYEPFTDCIYSDLGYCIIELLISESLGISFEEAITQMVFEPLLMKDSRIVDSPKDLQNLNFVWGHTKEGRVIDAGQTVYPYHAAAGMWCTSKDLAQLVIEVYNLMKGNGKLEIEQSLMLEMVKPQGCKPWSGLGVFLDTVDTNLEMSSFGWGVGFQCMFVGYPKDGTGAIIMTNTDTGVHQLKGFIGELFSDMSQH